MDDLDLQRFYRDRLDMCESDGWRALVKELEELSETTNNIDSMDNEKALWLAKGQLDVLRQIIALEDITKQAAEELEI